MYKLRTLPEHVKHFAIRHMIGQMADMKLDVQTATVASWLGCTKATAMKHLKKLEDSGAILRETRKWRGTATAFYWHLSFGSHQLYRKGWFKNEYQALLEAKGLI